MLFRGQSIELSSELGHVDCVIVRSDCQAIGDVLQSRDPEEYHANLIATIRKLGQRLGRHQFLRSRRQLRRSEFIRHAPKHLADLVLRLVAGIREEELYDRILAYHRMASDQREESQEGASPLLEKLRVRCKSKIERASSVPIIKRRNQESCSISRCAQPRCLPPTIFFGGNLGINLYGNRARRRSYSDTKSL